MTIEVQPPKKGGPWRWVLLIGCGLLLLGMGACAAMMALGYGFVTSTFVMDPARIRALAGEILPGAAAPPGYEPLVGMDVAGFKMAMFEPAEGKDAANRVGVMLFPMAPEKFGWQQAVEHMEKQAGESGDERVLSTSATTLPLGDREVPAVQQIVEENGVRKLRRLAMFGTPQDKVAMLMLEGPESGLDEEAFRAFVGAIRLDGYTVLGGDPQAEAGPPQPGATPRTQSPQEGPAEEEPAPSSP